MIACVQVVDSSRVYSSDKIHSNQIGKGFLIFLGVSAKDTLKEAELLAKKVSSLRVFPDQNDKMNLSLAEFGGEVLVISQFTLLANLKGANRPDFKNAAHGKEALALYEHFVAKLKEHSVKASIGYFGEQMLIESIHRGPVTIIIDTDKL